MLFLCLPRFDLTVQSITVRLIGNMVVCPVLPCDREATRPRRTPALAKWQLDIGTTPYDPARTSKHKEWMGFFPLMTCETKILSILSHLCWRRYIKKGFLEVFFFLVFVCLPPLSLSSLLVFPHHLSSTGSGCGGVGSGAGAEETPEHMSFSWSLYVTGFVREEVLICVGHKLRLIGGKRQGPFEDGKELARRAGANIFTIKLIIKLNWHKGKTFCNVKYRLL